jgi:hypothetical protein
MIENLFGSARASARYPARIFSWNEIASSSKRVSAADLIVWISPFYSPKPPFFWTLV